MAELSLAQMGLESTSGTLVPATHKWDGKADLEFLEQPVLPRYPQGRAQVTVEDAYIGSAAARITLADTPCSFQTLCYLLNMGVKQINGPATSFNFTFPTTAANTIDTFTWECVLARSLQEYEFGYGFASKISFHADCEEDGGVAKANAVIEGQVAAASTVTGSLSFIPSREMMNLRTATFKVDALGTAAGTAAATANTLRGFSLDIDTGWEPRAFADSRANKDWSVALFNPDKMKLTGKLRLYKNSTAVTQIANARAGTGIVVQVGFIGTGTLRGNFNLPILFLSPPKVDETTDYLDYDFETGYSSTTTAQGAAIALTLASTTIT